MTGPVRDSMLMAAKAAPPTAALATGVTADHVIAALTILYLVLMIGHTGWRWWKDWRGKQEAGE